MVKFVSVLGAVFVVAVVLSLAWPRISPYPRPEPLTRLRTFMVATTVGKQAAEVLGVSDEAQVVPVSPQGLAQSIANAIRVRVTDVVIAHAVREIMARFSQLSPEEQTRILDAISQSMNASSSASGSESAVKK